MVDVVSSVNNIPVRLTSERWNHIVENHNDMAGYYYEILETVANPSFVVEGDAIGEMWAVKLISARKAFLVVYKEMQGRNDGFIITAFITTKIKKLLKRSTLWKQQSQ